MAAAAFPIITASKRRRAKSRAISMSMDSAFMLETYFGKGVFRGASNPARKYNRSLEIVERNEVFTVVIFPDSEHEICSHLHDS